MEFRPLGYEISPFCRTEWFHVHVKMATIHLSQAECLAYWSRWFRHRPGFDSRQFAAQAEKWRGQEIANSAKNLL